MKKVMANSLIFLSLGSLFCTYLYAAPATGPLKVHPSNSRYFTDGSGKAIYLSGSHIHKSFSDSFPKIFDFDAHIMFLKNKGHNFMKLWAWESAGVTYGSGITVRDPIPYKRTGPGNANDGKLKFDLTQFNDEYFNRLRARCLNAGENNIYVSIMLFQGWDAWDSSKESRRDTWSYHPFHTKNNINGIDGDPNGNGEGEETHTLNDPSILNIQKVYIHKVVNTVNDLNNVLYEVSNEDKGSTENTHWQYYIINIVKKYEATKLKQHPIGMTAQCPNGSNWVLFSSPADWISPTDGFAAAPDYSNNPPAAGGKKVILLDTDHLKNNLHMVPATHAWVWKSFTRGYNPIYMDSIGSKGNATATQMQNVRMAMGHTLAYSRKINLASMIPRDDLSSSAYCLANPGSEYLIYLPSPSHPGERRFDRFVHKWVNWSTRLFGWNENVKIDLSRSSQTFRVEWFNPRTGETVDGGFVKGDGAKSLTAPFSGDAVLYVHKQ